MLNRVKLTDAEMKEFAEVFAYYDYGDDEIEEHTETEKSNSSRSSFWR